MRIEEELINKIKSKDRNVKELISYGTNRLFVMVDGDVRWMFKYNLSINRIDGIIYINKSLNKVLKFLTCDGGVIVNKGNYRTI